MSNVKRYRAAIITASDKGAKGEREDLSGAVLRRILEENGYEVVSAVILPDEKELLAGEMKRLADHGLCEVIFTTGGTGLSKRDVTPEATLSVGERLVPGISEAMRAYSMSVTKRAMLGRGVSVVRNETLIINLPGSPKAVRKSLEFIIGELSHGIAILKGDAGECAR